jgi:hypothetical protein
VERPEKALVLWLDMDNCDGDENMAQVKQIHHT